MTTVPIIMSGVDKTYYHPNLTLTLMTSHLLKNWRNIYYVLTEMMICKMSILPGDLHI